ncbi:hypothetical protein WJ91_17810 [Burkholderia ubonensis]|uniref:hypothetical protein n=1 Tax=Burkholderia ubonensis TaxID=101571 RepID=UPI00075620AF|nr:hypothetical protein [Burkholderia ubonensis]KVP56191.1 hypothetical protein WJ91_17810 [Burkholderia ubonensis]
MAKLFDQQVATRLVPIWHAAAVHLLRSQEREDYNLVLEITDPLTMADGDLERLLAVNAALKSGTACELTLDTVASTIFPQSMYRRHGRPGMYQKILSALDRGRKRSTWGTYAERMISRPAADGINSINPLEIMIEKLRANAKAKSTYRSSYELNLADPEVDLLPLPDDTEDGGDIPTYNPAFDARRPYGGPCLSNVSFKLVGKSAVNMTAVYRSHHYCARALGNLVGLARLLNFVATETGLAPGTLTCVSTFATLDVESWGGVKRAEELLA